MKKLTTPAAFLLTFVLGAFLYSGFVNAAVKDWSTTAANNDTADATITWTEGQAPSTVNDSARAMMAAVASWRDLIDYGTVSGCTVGGTGNAITLTCSPTVTAREAGRRYLFKAGAGNTGAVTLTVDSLSAGAVQFRTAALASGDIATNDAVLVQDDGTAFQLLTVPRVSLLSVVATQAQMETGTANTVPVSPGRVRYAAGVVKAWASFVPRGTNGAATLSASHNVSGVSRTAAGVYAVSFTTAQSGTAYACTGTANDASANNLLIVTTAKVAASCTIKQMSASTAAGSDLGDTIDVLVLGDE